MVAGMMIFCGIQLALMVIDQCRFNRAMKAKREQLQFWDQQFREIAIQAVAAAEEGRWDEYERLRTQSILVHHRFQQELNRPIRP